MTSALKFKARDQSSKWALGKSSGVFVHIQWVLGQFPKGKNVYYISLLDEISASL